MQSEEDAAAAVAFTPTATVVVFLVAGDGSVYRDGLQMCLCGRRARLSEVVPVGGKKLQLGLKKKRSRKTAWLTPLPSPPPPPTLSRPIGRLVIVAVQIDFQVNYSHVPLIIIISPLRPLLTPSVPLFRDVPR